MPSSPSSPSGSSGSPSIPSPSSGGQSGGQSGSQSGGQSGSSSGGGMSQPGSPGSGMPSPGSSSSSGKSGSSGGTEGSGGESLENLEQTLDDSLGDFDDMILQESTANSGDDEGVDIFDPISQSGGGDGPLFEESPLSEGEMADAQSSGGGGITSASSASASGGKGNASGGAANSDNQAIEMPADIDDGRGDDIVARQIREAAMSETDPALRDKLWEEYRRYKNQ